MVRSIGLLLHVSSLIPLATLFLTWRHHLTCWRTHTHSIARPLKSRFLEAAHIDRVRAGQLEVVEVNDLAKDSLEGVLNGE